MTNSADTIQDRTHERVFSGGVTDTLARRIGARFREGFRTDGVWCNRQHSRFWFCN